MKLTRLSLLFPLLLLGVSAGAQDFTFDELVKLRYSNLSDFETMVMSKGYEFSDVVKDYNHNAVFKKGDRTIAYTLSKNPHSQATDTIVTYRFYNLDEYNSILKQKKTDEAHADITHFFADGQYITHVYVDGTSCMHFRTKHSREPLYEVKVLPDNTDKYYQYQTLNGNIRW